MDRAESTQQGEVLIAGAMILNNLRAFADVVGRPVVDAAIESLPRGEADQIHALVPAGWIASSVCDRMFAAIAKQAGTPLFELFPRAIERGVERTLTTIWRPFLRLTSDQALLQRAPRLFAKTYTRGRLAVAFPEPGQATVELCEWPGVPELRILAVAAGVRTVLRLAGRKDVSVQFVRTPDGARFTARWLKNR